MRKLYELTGKDLQDVLRRASVEQYVVMLSFGNYRNNGRLPMKLVKVVTCGWEER